MLEHNDPNCREGTMTPERYLEIKDIFQHAIELPTEQRAGYLDAACKSDAEIRAELESLLAAHGAEGAQLVDERLTKLVPDLARQEVPDAAGRRIGTYRIVRLLGEGGMGAVYEASRADDQFQQRVALKLVKGAAYSDAVLQRFRQERQILATLDHPHIARLLDGGLTPEGQPYFIMEYVDGKPIDKYCEEKRLGIRVRLQLFRDVCSAVQYAHQNLVVHRDLKPGNILVTPDGQVKLLDFGIAKLLRDQDDQPADTLTMTGMHLMTPEYASPEQVRGTKITTATDVYSLGVVLYELLTGTRPFRLKERRQGEIERIICEQEPTRPSTAVKQTGSASMIGEMKPKRLRRALAGDLDNIVLRAMRKEPHRRYSSPEAMSEDIRRYLDGDPVTAHPPSILYQSSKFILRHRTTVAAACLLILSLTVGMVTTLWQAHEANLARAKAEQRFRQVRELANSILFEIQDSLQYVPGATNARKLLVDKGLVYLDSLARDSNGDPGLTRELGEAYQRLGDLQGNPVVANLGDAAGAMKSYQKAVVLLDTPAERNDWDGRKALGHTFLRMGDQYWAIGKLEESITAYRRSGDLLLQVLRERPGDVDSAGMAENAIMDYGELLVQDNRFDEAREPYQQVVELARGVAARTGRSNHICNVATILVKNGDLAFFSGHMQEARQYYGEAIDILEKLAVRAPNMMLILRSLIYARTSRATFLTEQHEPSAAVLDHNRALQIAMSLSRQDPKNQSAIEDLLTSQTAFAISRLALGQSAEALKLAQASVTNAYRLVDSDPQNMVALRELAEAREQVGVALTRQKKPVQAVAELRAVEIIFERLYRVKDWEESRRNLLSAELALAAAMRLDSQRNAALGLYQKAERLREEMRRAGPLSTLDQDLSSELDRAFHEF
jgi:eukaryotic-like serine/threonine-protein kinase